MTNGENYDIAISFLSRDESLAAELHDRLAETFRVFLYTKRQEDLGGKDGLEELRAVFRTRSRLNVVLYRPDWGSTPWTRVEKDAIVERGLNSGWDSTFVIMLNAADAPPNDWYPSQRIRFSIADFGIEQAIGAIKARAQETGIRFRRRPATEYAAQVAGRIRFNEERTRLFESVDGVRGAHAEYLALGEYIEGVVEEINVGHGFNILFGYERSRIVLTGKASLEIFWSQRALNRMADDTLRALYRSGRVLLPEERAKGAYLTFDPIEISSETISIDLTLDLKWAWRPARERLLLSTTELGERLVSKYLDIVERAEKGELPDPAFPDR